jgi:hypothetical protein
MMRSLRSLFSAMLFLLPFQSMAWGVLGHRITGGIAEKYLTPKAKTEIQKLLGNESIAMASNWGDFIKSDSSYNYISSWHYINLPGGMSPVQLNSYLKNDSGTDLYTKINFIISELKIKTLPKAKKILYLKLLIHFAGDIHQPMHTAHPEDKGGNNIRLFWFNSPTNLHRIWDENLVEFQQLSYTEYISSINFATASQIKQWQKQPVSEWIVESYRISEQLYKEIRPDDKLSYSYNYNHVSTLNAQLLKGGIRLAGLLNQLFG